MAVGFGGGDGHVPQRSDVAKITETARQRIVEGRAVGSKGGGNGFETIGRYGLHEIGEALAVVQAATADDAAAGVEGGWLLRRRDAEVKRVPQRYVHDDGLDEHLRQRHVQLGDDALDHFQVRPRGVDEE